MGLFKIKAKMDGVKPTIKYSQMEQGMAKEELAVPVPPVENAQLYLLKIDQVLANQVVIADNQIMAIEEARKLMAAVAWIQEQIRNGEPVEEVEPEPTPEEMAEAMADLKRKRAMASKVKKK